LGPGDGAAAEHLVMNCATKSLEIGIPKSIGIWRTHRQKIPLYRDTQWYSQKQHPGRDAAMDRPGRN
jgi:hypothetical protein